MNLNNMTAKELAGYVYITGPKTDAESAMLTRLQETVDELEDMRALLGGMRAEIRKWQDKAEEAELGYGK